MITNLLQSIKLHINLFSLLIYTSFFSFDYFFFLLLIAITINDALLHRTFLSGIPNKVAQIQPNSVKKIKKIDNTSKTLMILLMFFFTNFCSFMEIKYTGLFACAALLVFFLIQKNVFVNLCICSYGYCFYEVQLHAKKTVLICKEEQLQTKNIYHKKWHQINRNHFILK